MMKQVFRPIVKDDLKVLIPMYKKNFAHLYPFDEDGDWVREEFERAFKDHWRRPHYFVLTEKGEIVAMGGYEHSNLDGGMYDLISIQVNKEHRGKGLGTVIVGNILKEIKKNFSEKRDQTVLLSCLLRLQSFYSKHGFRVIYNKASYDECIMAKSYEHIGDGGLVY